MCLAYEYCTVFYINGRCAFSSANGSYFDSETSSHFPLIEFKIGSLLFLNWWQSYFSLKNYRCSFVANITWLVILSFDLIPSVWPLVK